MKEIRLLDEQTINAIAAGEVVERPASVVKELVENAVDAGATAISIEIRGGGIDLIRVTDNGGGIRAEDIREAFVRHATSKIRSAADLLSIGSLGFRGEALSSIAAVSQTELLTKTRDDLAGRRYCIEGGEEKSLEDVACPDGTTILVRNLFYNTPARRKFLKTAQTEGGYVSELVSRLALARPDISFKYTNAGRVRLSTTGNGKLKEIIYQVFGRDVALHLLELSETVPWMQIGGYIGKPILSRGNRSWENYFINGRYIHSDVITRAIEDAYKTFVMIHKFPFTALCFTIEPELMDVNVHPRKMEIRFNRNEEIYRLVYDCVRRVLQTRELTPQGHLLKESSPREAREGLPAGSVPEPFESRRKLAEASGLPQQKMELTGQSRPLPLSTSAPANRLEVQAGSSVSTAGNQRDETGRQEIKDVSHGPEKLQAEISPLKGKPVRTQAESPLKGELRREEEGRNSLKGEPDRAQEDSRLQKKEDPVPAADRQLTLKGVRQEKILPENLMDPEAAPYTRLVGQVFGTYWIMEFAGRMYIMDQHAAHEKVLYEKLKKDLKQGSLVMQHLAPPLVMTLTAREQDLLDRYRDFFSGLCFEIEPFGGDEYAVYGVPSFLFGLNIRDLFVEIMDSLSQVRAGLEGSQITWKIASMACKAAVKGNQTLSREEALSLLDQLRRCEDPYNCPHGRPTIVAFSRYEMDRRFKRIQD